MKILFVPGSKEIEALVPCPETAKKNIPDWYKDIPGGENIVNVKRCVPFLDSLSHGYIQKTWTDIHVSLDNDIVNVDFDSKVTILSLRKHSDMPFTDTFYNAEFVWQRPWSVIVPDGFSALVVHPLNRYDLPFITLSGIVDFDKSIHAPVGNIPFYIKKGFTGTIPSGTPMFQIIPIKREEWISDKIEYSDSFWQSKIKERDSKLGFYKKKIWTKKQFD